MRKYQKEGTRISDPTPVALSSEDTNKERVMNTLRKIEETKKDDKEKSEPLTDAQILANTPPVPIEQKLDAIRRDEERKAHEETTKKPSK